MHRFALAVLAVGMTVGSANVARGDVGLSFGGHRGGVSLYLGNGPRYVAPAYPAYPVHQAPSYYYAPPRPSYYAPPVVNYGYYGAPAYPHRHHHHHCGY